jgi:hypothetical protein
VASRRSFVHAVKRDLIIHEVWFPSGKSHCLKNAHPWTSVTEIERAFIDNLYSLAAEKLLDLVVLDLDILGMPRWRRVMPKPAAAGLQASPHTWMWRMRSFYTAQLGGGPGNIPIVGGIPMRTSGVDESAYVWDDGRLVMPEKPGFALTSKPGQRTPPARAYHRFFPLAGST